MCIVDVSNIKELLNNISKRVSEFNKNMNIVIHYGIYQVEDKNISIELMCDRAIIAASMVKTDIISSIHIMMILFVKNFFKSR